MVKLMHTETGLFTAIRTANWLALVKTNLSMVRSHIYNSNLILIR